jgi:hypothetical protein
VIKLVTATIMLIVAVSRALVVPVYLAQLGHLDLSSGAAALLKGASFVFMIGALAVGTCIILGAMISARGAAKS